MLLGEILIKAYMNDKDYFKHLIQISNNEDLNNIHDLIYLEYEKYYHTGDFIKCNILKRLYAYIGGLL